MFWSGFRCFGGFGRFVVVLVGLVGFNVFWGVWSGFTCFGRVLGVLVDFQGWWYFC